MTAQKRRAPGAGELTGRTSETLVRVSLSVADHLDMPHGRALAGPPCPGRTLWAVTTPTCPRCGGMHQHRVGEAGRLLSGRIVKVCPTTGQPYRLGPVQRRREARRV